LIVRALIGDLKTSAIKMDTEVTILRKKVPTGGLKSNQAVNAARRTGAEIETKQKTDAGKNTHAHAHGIDKSHAFKLETETEELKHATVTLEVGKLIQQGRQAKGMTQKDLAVKINEKPNVVHDYENAKGIPNPNILGKMERALGIKLRGKDKGKPLNPPGGSK